MFDNDTLTEYKLRIDYHKNVIVFNIKRKLYEIPFVKNASIPVCGTLKIHETARYDSDKKSGGCYNIMGNGTNNKRSRNPIYIK